MRILVVDDEPAVRMVTKRILQRNGYAVLEASGGPEALRVLREHPGPIQLLLTDVIMPEMNGRELAERVRERRPGIKVMYMSAYSPEAIALDGLLDEGATFLRKPFALEELLARLRALLRRYEPEPNVGAELVLGDLRLDLVAYEAWRGDRQIQFTRTEWLLLELFLRNPRQVLTRSVINERVWGYDFGPASNSLGVYVGYLRRKLEQDGRPRLIHTMRGVGYVLREPT